ncbi:Tether containing UBX domain for GLUT4 [Dissostichus eleginoides]|uniref:Tether containing UBX domain for GLUT4 n=1 Tax=Dissostichus eleginoides TaxID=100907 RepID=A0AAD9BKR9_DISEL|nr:Tether containing UBX domain for GLUT4 [Dissostichus eleginoides]
MRDEVSGEEALKKTTLRSLGLTGGNAIVRFLLKKNKAEGDTGEATEAAAMPTMLVAKKTTPSPSSLPDPAPSPPEMSKTEMPIKHVTPQQPIVAPTPASAPSRSLPVQKEEVPISQDAVRPKVPPVERVTLEEDGGQRLGGPQGGAVGRPLSSSSSSSALTIAVDSPKAKKLKSSHGSSIKGQSTANQPDEDMDLGEFSAPAERELLIYHLDAVSRHSDHRDLPDEFFEVTMDDVRKRFAQLKSQRRHLEEAPLMTKALRESQMREKMERYPKVVLRVQFPDRHVLQGFFRPLETVGAVRKFVSIITPPKTILDDPSATLFQADLFPGALVYFGSDDNRDIYMKKELVDSSVSALQANESIASCMLRSPTASGSSEGPEEPPALEPRADPSGAAQDSGASSENPRLLNLPGLTREQCPSGSSFQVRNETAAVC